MTPTPSQCTVCDRVFAKADHLVRHLRRHTGAKPYSCDECSKTFARKDVLLRHGRAHRHLAKVASARTTPAGSPVPEGPSSDSELEFEPDEGAPMTPTNALVAVSVMQLASMAASRASSPAPHASGSGLPPSALIPSHFSRLFPEDSVRTPIASLPPSPPPPEPEPAGGDDSECLPFAWPTPPGALAPPFVNSPPVMPPQDIDAVFRSWVDVSIDAPAGEDRKVASPLSRIDHAGTLRLWPAASPVEFKDPANPFELPSSQFLATTLQKHFSTPHEIHTFIHTPTFNPQRHSPMCLLAMCANGAAPFATPQARQFQEDVFLSVRATLRQYTVGAESEVQPLDLIQCAVITIYTAIMSGESLALSAARDMLVSAVTLGRKIGLFSSTGPTAYDLKALKTQSLDEGQAGREWLLFVGSEVAKRLAHQLVRLSVSLAHALSSTGDPLFSLDMFTIAQPCSVALWSAPDADEWCVAAKKGGIPESPAIVMVLGLLHGQPPDQPLEPLQLQAALALVDVHSRWGRWNHALDNATIARAVAQLPSTQSTAPSPGSSSSHHSHHLSLISLSPIAHLESLAGRSAPPASDNPAFFAWLDSPAARLAVLHAAQILAEARHRSYDPLGESWDFMMVLAPFQALLVLWVYETMWGTRERAGGGQVVELGTEVNLGVETLLRLIWDDQVKNEVGEDTVGGLATWVAHGGPTTFLGESLRSSRARADLLLAVATDLEANAALSGAAVGRVYAGIVRKWLEAELLE